MSEHLRRPSGRGPRGERPTLYANAKVSPSAVCKCGHLASSHYQELPSPCKFGRTMPDAEIVARCMEDGLTSDPRYGCKCIGFSHGAPS